MLKNMYDDNQHMITSYIILYDSKAGEKCIIGYGWVPWRRFISVVHVKFFMMM